MSLSYLQTLMYPSTFQILPALIGLSFTQNKYRAAGYTGTYIHTYIHTYTHTCIHTHTHTHISKVQ